MVLNLKGEPMGRLLDEDMVINALQTTKFRNDLFVDRGYARAISIIRELPTIQPVATDAISRRAAIDALQKCRKHCIDPFDSYHIDIQDAEYQLSKLPTIQPEGRSRRERRQ